ncbi:MAG: hypothetical protein ACTHKJ_00590 [Candidatus Nitrosocosmicus sp.]
MIKPENPVCFLFPLGLKRLPSSVFKRIEKNNHFKEPHEPLYNLIKATV